MLAVSFFVAVFSTFVWLIYSFMYVRESLAGAALSSLALADMAAYVSIVVLPIFILWLFFGQVITFINTKNFSANLYSLFKQMKKNQDYTDLVARILLETEQGVRNGFILNKFDLFISDMNELLAEIMHRCNLASNDQIEKLWVKVQNGGKWAFGKVFIEINNSQPNFPKRIFERAQVDGVLAGTILEFSSRYLTLVALLEKHDRERIFLNIIETGVYAKVFSIFAPVSDEIKKTREVFHRTKDETKLEEKEEEETLVVEKTIVTSEQEVKAKTKKSKLFGRKEVEETEKDPFSIALERSFSEENAGPRLEAPSAVEAKAKAKENLKKLKVELEGIERDFRTPLSNPDAEEKREEKDENLGYPFAGWIDEDNYSKK